MTLLLDRPDARVYHADWRGLLDALPRRDDGTVCDSVIADCPYSERTHAGHDGQSDALGQRVINYAAWSPEDVAEFVGAWAPVTRGWLVSLTDDVLLAAWKSALADAGRQTFADVPAVIRGMTVRYVGDGPSSWAIHCAVARPRSREFATWGTLQGAYVGPSERQDVVGGKPLWLMRALVRDYTRPGDLVADPCCGAGTTLLAAVTEGRRAVGGDVLREHAEMSARRLDGMVQQPLFGGLE